MNYLELRLDCADIDAKQDFLAFSLVVYVAKTPQPHGLKIPKILLTIVGDSAKYFLVIFSSHFALELTLTLGRVSLIVSDPHSNLMRV